MHPPNAPSSHPQYSHTAHQAPYQAQAAHRAPDRSDQAAKDKRILGIAAGVAPMVLGLVVLATNYVRGPEIHIHNDRDVAASVTIGDDTIEIEPGAWATARVPSGETTTMSTVFADGETAEIDVDGTTAICTRDYRAYALAGTQCYAMLDISPIFDAGEHFRVLRRYDHETRLELGRPGSCAEGPPVFGEGPQQFEYTNPGEDLPEKLYLGTGDGVARLYPVPCGDVSDEDIVMGLVGHEAGQ
ncbi:MAG: hypothetical protein AAF721_15515 [Myxococcota bacterium]